MKTFSQSIKQVAVVSGLFLGAFVLSALAADWTPPTANPPSNNTPAPINVGSSTQAKVGPFAVGQATVAESGLDFQVAKVAKLGALLVSGDVTVPSGKTYTNKIQIGDVDPNSVNHVLTKTDAAGNAEWKPNTAGLSGASRIYCAGATTNTSEGGENNRYYVPKSGSAIYDLIKKINSEVSSDLLGTDQLLNEASGKGLLKASFLTAGSVQGAVTVDDPTVKHEYTNPPRAYCPTGKSLIFHSMVGWAKDEADNALERIVTVVKGDYTANSISCIAKGQDRPTLVVGMGLCI